MSDNQDILGNLSSPQRQAIEALASGATKEQAATVAGRERRTIDRWIAEDEAFQEALGVASGEAVRDAGRRLSGLLERAIEAVDADLKSGEMKARENLRALDIAARHVVKLRELAALEERLNEFSERLAALEEAKTQ